MSAAAEPVLRVTDLRVVYGSRRAPVVAVAGASLSVDRGATVAIIGESGSGKSSLARAICGLTPAASGRVEAGSPLRDITGLTARANGIQLVHQNPFAALDPRWPVWRSVAEPLRLPAGASHRDRRGRAAELLTRVGIPEALHDRRPRQLSGGQCQRVTIARSLAAGPELVILDEAVSALDVSVKNEILGMLEDLKEMEHLSYLFVTHDMAAVAQVATDVVVMLHGEIVESGPVDDVLRHPRVEYTQNLIRAVPGFDAVRDTHP
jgi:peptide/nickel transport system ATP-binding protein